MKWTIGVLFVAACGVAQAADGKAPAQQGVCSQLESAVENGVKEMAFYDQADLGTQALEVTNRKLNMVAEATKVQSNLMLMQANKCPMPKEPINPGAYFHSAFACVHAPVTSTTASIPECDRAKWVKSTK